MRKQFVAILSVSVLLASSASYGEDVSSNILDRAQLSSRSCKTWEGVYSFSKEVALSIDGQRDLHVLEYTYEHGGQEGTLIEFARDAGEGRLQLLLTANTNRKGTMLVLEGIDVLVEPTRGRIIVRWLVPGTGHERVVDLYNYDGNVQFVESSLYLVAFANGQKTMRWVSEESLKHGAVPARLAVPSDSKNGAK